MVVGVSPANQRAKRALAWAVALVVVVVSLSQVFPVAVVDGNSMLPTYHSGEYLLVNRLWRQTGGIRRGDVVVFRHGADVLVKRAGYIGGDVIPAVEGRSYAGVKDLFERASPGRDGGLKVPSGCIVALGDNRPESDDSRAFGPVPVEDLLGRVVWGRLAR